MSNASQLQRVEATLRYLLEQWRNAPEWVRLWHEQWDEARRLSFALEWNHTEASLQRLRELVAEADVTPEQRAAYEEIETLVHQHGDAIRGLAYEDMPGTTDRLASRGPAPFSRTNPGG